VSTYQAGAVLESLGDPTRRKIFELLGARPQAVGELAAQLPVSRPAVSQHLKVLKDVGLVIDRARGTRRIYQVDRDGLAALRTYLDRIWTDALDAFKQAAEEQQ
jgi:DNA-binding transcriptional ArsR family regulator